MKRRLDRSRLPTARVAILTLTPSPKQIVRSTVPRRYHQVLRGWRHKAVRVAHVGNQRYCPCCDSHVRRFSPYGADPRPNAQCPVCGALERHRLISLFLQSRREDLLNPLKRVLHVAPEPPVAQILEQNTKESYVTMDLCEDNVMVHADLTKLPFPTNAFDAVYCSHVLEHIPDDKGAMKEMQRILKPSGWAMIQVPIKRQTTIEDPSITDPEERLRLFGQRDHVRIYGRDFETRLAEARFSVAVEQPQRELDETTVERCGLMTDDDIFLCRKAA